MLDYLYMKKISVIIPVYNHVTILSQNVSKIISVMNKCGCPYEIILINDGSTDGSDHVLSQLNNGNIRCITKKNQGLGSVIQLGFSLASGQIIIILDLDLSYDIQNIYKVIGLANNWECVVCSKYADENNYPLHRKVLSYFNHLLCKFIFNISVRDIGSGFVMLHKYLVQNESFICNGFGFHCELFFILHKKKAKILELPVQYTHYPGTYRILIHSLQTIKEIKSIMFKK